MQKQNFRGKLRRFVKSKQENRIYFNLTLSLHKINK